jgi:hypothetical protein
MAANIWVQATPGFACVLFQNQWPGAPDPIRSSMAGRSSRFTNPEGWQTVAGGRNAVETPGSGCIGPRILEGCQSAATPPGSMRDLGRRSGGLAPLDPRLPSGKPPACVPADPKTNDVPQDAR